MTKIEWTEKTWNPIVGCSIVSPGCTNCYAMKMAARLQAMAMERADGSVSLGHYLGTTQPSKAGPVWTGKLARAPDHILTEPLRRKKPTMWFVNSMSDLFHEDVPDEWIDIVFAVMALTPQHTYQVLTKRSARMRNYCTSNATIGRVVSVVSTVLDGMGSATVEHFNDRLSGFHLENVWLGVSAERQQEADARIPDLLATPAAVRFVSAEPLLGPIDFTRIVSPTLASVGSSLDALTPWRSTRLGGRTIERGAPSKTLDWVIVGGESGPTARPMHPDWVLSIRDQCTAAGVPFFFKQWGEFGPGDPQSWVFDERDGNFKRGRDVPGLLRKLGKKAAGRLLDGRTWDEMPSRDSRSRPASPVGATTAARPAREVQS